MKPPAPRIPKRLAGVLVPYTALGVLDASDVAVCDVLTRTTAEHVVDDVIHAIAMVCIARRMGHSCLHLADAKSRLLAAVAAKQPSTAGFEADVAQFEFFDNAQWGASLGASELVEVTGDSPPTFTRPLMFDASTGTLWLSRYAYYEHELATRLLIRAKSSVSAVDQGDIEAALASADTQHDRDLLTDEQRDAIIGALTRPLTFLIGGPGTGKTWTVGRLVDAAHSVGFADSDIALSAPTGKAAERMTRSITSATSNGVNLRATTNHKLLGGMYPGATPRPGERTIAQRLVIIDEASMIDLPMMARLTAAVRADAHLVFVGDPDQLASVDVGSVLSDVVDAASSSDAPLHATLARLTTMQRQSAQSPIIALAAAIQQHVDTTETDSFEAIRTLLGIHDHGNDTKTEPAPPKPSSDAALRFVHRTAKGDSAEEAALFNEVAETARIMIEAARDPKRGADALHAMNQLKVLSANHRGKGSVEDWSKRLRKTLGFRDGEWQVGRPIMITRNDPVNGLSNGDTGITVNQDGSGTSMRVAFATSDGGFRTLPPSALGELDDWWAMTIHKSQGSEYDHVIVSLPSERSPLLTRELIYTAVTRAKARLTIIGTPDVLVHAIATPTSRASGLAARLH